MKMKTLISIFVIAVIAVSCNTMGNSDAAKNDAAKARVQSFYDQVINAHNPTAVDSFCAADFVDHNPDPGHSGKGTAELKTSFGDFFTAFPDVHVKTNFMVAEGDTVVAHVTLTGTNSGTLGGMPATNKSMTVDGVDIIHLKDGKAVERWGVFDNAKMMQDLGMMPAPTNMADSTAPKK